MIIFQIIIDHAPYWCFTRTGNRCDNFNCMLTIKYIVNPISSTNFNGIDLVWIKMFCGIFDMFPR